MKGSSLFLLSTTAAVLGASTSRNSNIQNKFQKRSLGALKPGCSCSSEPRPQYHLQGQWFLNLRTCDPKGKLFVRSPGVQKRSKECIPTAVGYENHPADKSSQILVITKCGCA